MIDEVLFSQPQKSLDTTEGQHTSNNIRIATPADAKPLFELINDLMKDGQYYLSDSLPYTLEQQEEYLRKSGKDHTILVSEDDTGLTGWVSLQRSRIRFSAHVGNIIMGVRKDKQHSGIGTLLLKQMEYLAQFMGIEKLELAVRATNTTGYNFYIKNGFREEGRKIKSIKNSSGYDDEILMAKHIRT